MQTRMLQRKYLVASSEYNSGIVMYQINHNGIATIDPAVVFSKVIMLN